MGFCSDTDEGRDWLFWIWPYTEEEAEWAAEEPIYYWIPQVDTDPWGCQLTFEVNNKKNVEWEWDEWCTEEEIDHKTCQSLMLWPKMLEEDSRSELYLKFKVGVQGADASKYYYQFFKWDWEMYNMYADEWDDDMDCAPGDPMCEDWDDEDVCEDCDYEDEFDFEDYRMAFGEFGYDLTQEVYDIMMEVEDPSMLRDDQIELFLNML
jgi:hypothetical protein